MFRQGRVWLAGLVVTALAASTSVQAADPKFFPNDIEIVFAVNFKQVMESDLAKLEKERVKQLKDFVKQKLSDNPAGKYLEKAGFDLFRDLGSLTIAMPPSTDPDQMFMMVEGAFDVAKLNSTIEEAARENGDLVKVRKIGKYKVYQVSPAGEKQIYATLLNDKTLAMCTTEEGINGAIARASGSKRSTLKKQLASLLQTTSAKQSMSFVATGSALAKLAENAPNQNEQVMTFLKSVDGVSGAITVGKDVQMQIGIAMTDAATAKNWANQANLGLKIIQPLIAQQAENDPRAQPAVEFIKSVRVTTQGSTLLFRGQLSTETVRELLKNLPGGPPGK